MARTSVAKVALPKLDHRAVVGVFLKTEGEHVCAGSPDGGKDSEIAALKAELQALHAKIEKLAK